jgi:hypothetical protein
VRRKMPRKLDSNALTGTAKTMCRDHLVGPTDRRFLPDGFGLSRSVDRAIDGLTTQR